MPMGRSPDRGSTERRTRIWTAVNGPDQGNLVLIKARDAKTLGKIRDTLLKFAREDAKKKDQPSPFEEERYRDITVYKVKDGGGIHDDRPLAPDREQSGARPGDDRRPSRQQSGRARRR